MTMPESGQSFEIYYGLHGGPPIKIGGGTYEDVKRAGEEASAINANTDVQPANDTSPGTRHFYEEMGRTGGVEEVALAALEHYDELTERSRLAFLERIREAGEG